MRKILLTFCLSILISVTHSQTIHWITLGEAIHLQKTNPRKIVMDVYTAWCGPCKYMDIMTFDNPDVINYVNENYYAVKFNAEGNETISYKGNDYTNAKYNPQKSNSRNSPHDFATYMQIVAFPTAVFFDEKGEFITQIKGALGPHELELYLKLFAKDKYKDIKTEADFKSYTQAFKPNFKLKG